MKDLRHMYSTFSFMNVIENVDGRKIKKTISNTTIVTPSGKYKEQEWESLLLDQAKQLHELDIIDKLKKYSFDTCAWINKEKDAYDYTLSMYSSKMYKNEKWVGYEEFQTILYPNIEVEQIRLL